MARPINEFVLAWDALSGVSDQEGWRSIAVAPAGSCALMAGRRFPGNEEALLAGFSAARLPSAEKLPEGKGFEVSRVDSRGDGKIWIALSRKASGSVELFTEMVADVTGAMDAVAVEGEERILRTLLSRVQSWQDFMQKALQALSPEAEIGLVGEISFLSALLDAGIPAPLAVETWVGPLDAVQDFVIGTGAVEVKTTTSSPGFLAKIGSLEQLDDAVRKPLFIAGVRLLQEESGRNLPEFVAALKDVIKSEVGAAGMFVERLLAVGYHESHADRYSRRFVFKGVRVIEVGEGFPRIIPGTVPDGIKRVSYEIDLDRIAGEDAGVVGALKKLGAL